LSAPERRIRVRFWLEVACGLLGCVLFTVTLVSHEWIELIFGVNPDGGSGSLELAIAFGLLAVAAGSGVLAVREWRRALTT
jgi:hypothetical protein